MGANPAGADRSVGSFPARRLPARLVVLMLSIAVVLSVAGDVRAQSADVAHPDPATEQRLRALGEELRCLVCQNQTIADSSAPLALDLRNQIRTQIAQGRDDDQIRTYMVERYGDFVLYRPPFKATTAVLWVAPFVLVLLGAALAFGIVRRRKGTTEAPLAPQRRREIDSLLEAPDPPPGKNRA